MIFSAMMMRFRSQSLRRLSTMRRVLLAGPGPAEALRPETIPYDATAPVTAPEHARIRVAACAVAYRDIIDRTGGFPFMNKPTVLGHEFCGVVEAVGPGCALRPGDRVASLHWAQLGGKAFPSPFERKDSMKTFLGLTCDGGYEEFVTTHETAFVKVPNPSKFSAIEVAPVMSTFGTVWQGCVVRGRLQKGERVLVTGAAGGVGGSAVTMLKRLGAHIIGATGDVAGKGDYIRSLGADEVIDSKPDFSKSLGQNAGVDMVVECVGAPTFTDSLRSLKPGGRLVLIGNVTNANVSLPLGLCIVKSLSVIGTDSIEAKELESLFLWLDAQGIRPRIDRVLPLEQAAEAHALVEQRKVAGRIVLDVNSAIW